MSKNQEVYRWTEFPRLAEKGRNVIDLFCPEASNEDDGWEIYIARATNSRLAAAIRSMSERHRSSRRTARIMETEPFGPLGQSRAEYSVRLSLDRYVREGWLASPVIDLWKGDSDAFVVPLRRFNRLESLSHRMSRRHRCRVLPP